MPDLRQTRKKLKLILSILAGVSLLAAVVYFSGEPGGIIAVTWPFGPTILLKMRVK